MANRVWGAGSGAGTNGLYSTAANWTDDTKPIAGDTATFNGGVVLDCRLDEALDVAAVDMQSGYTGTINGATDDLSHAISKNAIFDGTRFDMGDGTYTVGGNFDNKDVTTFNANGSTLILNGVNKTLTGVGSNMFENLTIDGIIITNANEIICNNNLTVNGRIAANGIQKIRLIGPAFLQVASSGIITGTGELRFSNESGITQQDGKIDISKMTFLAAHITGTIIPATYESATVTSDNTGAGSRTLRLSSGSYIFTGDVVFLVNNTGGTVIDNVTNNPNLEFQGNVTLTETAGTITWTKGTGEITLAGTGSGTQTIDFLDKSVEAITVNASGATKQISNDLNTVSMDVLIGTLDTNAKDITTTGDFRVRSPASIADLAGSTLTIGDDFNAFGDPDADIALTGTSTWFLNVTGDNFAAYATVTNCDASGGSTLNVFQGTDGGGNTNVNFNIVVDPTVPTTPTLTVTDKADGTGVSYTIAGADAGTSNATFFFADAATSAATLGDIIVGNSSGSISITVAGVYWFYTVSSFGAASSITDLVRVDVTDLGETAVNPQENQVAANGVDTLIQAKSLTPTGTSARTPSWTTRKTIKGWKQDIGSNLRIQYEARDLVVTHKVFVAVDPEAVEGDRLVQAGVNFLIRGVVNQAGLSTLWRLDCEQVN